MAEIDRKPMIFSKIGIVGAGVSGLAALKRLARHDPIVFEASDRIGGVWNSCSYNSTKLQSGRRDYEFSDFPWPENKRDDESFPSYAEIVEYLESYAKHFDVLKCVKFNTKVIEVKFVGEREKTMSFGTAFESGNLTGNSVWEVAVQTNDSEHIQWYGFEYLVVCTGKYGDVATMPVFPAGKGPEIFKGKVMHSMDYCKLDKDETSELLKGKKVAVIGFKKSAIDLAMECVEANQGGEGKACTMVVRTAHWTVPNYWVWGLPFFLFYSTRLSQFLHERPNQSFLRSLLCFLFSPIRHAISKFIESYLLWKLPLEKFDLKPEHSFEEDYASCQMAILPEKFFEEAENGRIEFKRASEWWFCEEGIEFDDGSKSEADVVILATGYDGKKKLKAIVPEPFRTFLEFPSGIMPLYRGTVHPLIPNMAFIGYIQSNSNLHTSELRATWLARMINGKFKLPSVEKMLLQISEEIEVMKKNSRFYKRHCISTFSINHGDDICEEMGINPWRKKNWLLEVFSPYGSQDYREDDD